MRSWTIALATALLVGLPADDADAGRRRRPPLSHEATGHLTFTSPQSSPIAVSPDGSLVFVTSATSHRVDVINTTSNVVIRTVDVGMEPVSIAFKPDGSEAWVSNHVSDSVSVIDTAQASGSFLRVVETLQDLGADGRTSFDEPVGIAFASNSKAYVALSSRDQIAVVDATTYSVTGRIQLTAQEPRAIAVQGGRLFVAAFESGNQSQASFCNALFPTGGVGDPCSLGLQELGQFVTNPNLPGEIKNIVQDGLPDRDLFVYRTDTDALLETVTGVGTLLYGLAVDGSQNVFVSQTDARNLANGDHGDLLVDLENRIFLNQIASLDCGGSNGNPCGAPTQHELEPALPSQPASTDALATPFGIALTSDDATLVVTAAATSRLFTASAANPSQVLDRLDVGAIPRGVALRDNGDGTHTAYVLNTLDNSVSVVSVTNSTGALSLVTTVPVGADPTPDAVRRGRIRAPRAHRLQRRVRVRLRHLRVRELSSGRQYRPAAVEDRRPLLLRRLLGRRRDPHHHARPGPARLSTPALGRDTRGCLRRTRRVDGKRRKPRRQLLDPRERRRESVLPAARGRQPLGGHV
jgi:YVTN family beta-propeller protein